MGGSLGTTIRDSTVSVMFEGLSQRHSLGKQCAAHPVDIAFTLYALTLHFSCLRVYVLVYLFSSRSLPR